MVTCLATLFATPLEIMIEVLAALPLPLAYLVVGTAAIGGFLWLATFSASHIRLQCRAWFTTGVRYILVFLALELRVVARLRVWWWRDLVTMIGQAESPMCPLIGLLVWGLSPLVLMVVFILLLQFSYCKSNYL